ncbi:unnamed protein product [Closterium sp. NIES-64]|nr:unnamed protein product [Closterium sp. NIES-64]
MSDPKVSAIEAQAERSEATEPLGAQQAVMIFVKRPAPGRVKTRLAAGVGADAACDFYCACCEHVVTNIARCPDLHASTHVFIFFSEPSDEGEIKRWMQQVLPSSTSLRFVPQVGGDVGARMQAAFQQVLGLGYQRVVVIGTDIPDADGATVAAALSPPHCLLLVVVIGSDIPDVDGATVAAALSALRHHRVRGGEGRDGTGGLHSRMAAALSALRHHRVVTGSHIPDVDGANMAAALLPLWHHPVVFGPALDGGYYLLGLTAVLPCLFHVWHRVRHGQDACVMLFSRIKVLELSLTLFPCSSPCSPSPISPRHFSFLPPSSHPPSFSHTTIPHQGIEWSTDRVLQQSLSALHTNGVADMAPLTCLPLACGASTQYTTSHPGSSPLSYLPCLSFPGPHQGIEWSTDRVLQQSLQSTPTQFLSAKESLACLQPAPLSLPRAPSGHRVEHGQGAAAVTLSTPHQRGG